MPNTRGRRRRFGSVRKLPSGRWQVRFPDPETGLTRTADGTFGTKRDAEVALSQIEADVSRGRWVNPDAGKVNFGEYAAAWLREREVAVSTRERHEVVLRLHILPALGRLTVDQVTTQRVRHWRAGLLEAGVGEPTVVRAYQVLRAIMHTAVDDELVQRNPCRIKGAGITKSPERPVLTVEEVFRVSEVIGSRYKALVLLAGFSGLRFGELAALQRSDLDLERHRVQVRRAQVETRAGLLVKAPKSAAGVRAVVFPSSIVPVLDEHLARFSEPGRSGLVFVGPRGGALRRSNFRDTWTAAVAKAGLSGVHFHDLRHTGNTLAASSGASTRELMQRMGHSSTRAALIYQHLLAGRDEEIAAHVDGLIRRIGDVAP